MKAAVVENYGPPDVVRIRELPKPEIGDGDVLIRVRATSVNIADARIRALRVPRGLGLMARMSIGLLRPRTPVFGLDVAGVIEAVGREVTAFKPGDRVVASRGFKMGGHAEYFAIPATETIVAIPDGLSDEDAVSVLFGGATSLVFFNKGRLKAGEQILINGGSGAVGTMAVQLAKHQGAVVTAVTSGANQALVISLGADHVIDYTKKDFTKGAARYDVVMDNHGNAPYAKVKHLLKPGGRFLMVIGDLGQMLAARAQKAVISAGKESEAINPGNYDLLLALVAQGTLKPVIDSVYPFEEIARAHARVDTGHKRGSVVVTIAAPEITAKAA